MKSARIAFDKFTILISITFLLIISSIQIFDSSTTNDDNHNTGVGSYPIVQPGSRNNTTQSTTT